MKVLIAEDNERLSERVAYKLRDTYVVDRVNTGEAAVKQAEDINYSTIILDLGLPDITGLEVCQKIRGASCDTPILVLTGQDSIISKVELLESGADDYMIKPFDINELRARLHALGRRSAREKSTSLVTFKDIVIDADKREVYRNHQLVKLRRKEFDILLYLIKNRGRVMTRQMIMNHAWSQDTGSWVSTVDVHIKHLRDKIDKPFDTRYIKTAYGLGYKIEAT